MAQTAQMDFSREDKAPQQLLKEAIWQSVRGADSEMPAPIHTSLTDGTESEG